MDSAAFDKLTPRQGECLRGLAALKRPKEIAQELGLSPRSVEGYIAEAVRRLGAPNARAAAVAFVEHERRLLPYESPQYDPRVEVAPAMAATIAHPAAGEAVPLGRVIRIGPLARLGIIVGLAIFFILVVCLIVIAGDVIERHERVGGPSSAVAVTR